MKIRMRLYTAMYALSVALCAAPMYAAFTFLEPTPYLSAVDSPFDLSGLGSTFFLEDFEDSEANTPSLSIAWAGGIGLGASVDADDGAIDGYGTFGHSMNAGTISESSGSSGVLIRLEFDQAALGRYPTHVGLVMTDGGGFQSRVRAVGASGDALIVSTVENIFDNTTAADDLFFGFVNPNGISAIEVSKTILSSQFPRILPAIDHVQYGVPEPESISLLIYAIGALFHFSRRHFKR